VEINIPIFSIIVYIEARPNSSGLIMYEIIGVVKTDMKALNHVPKENERKPLM
jgi:hypothetical protein